MYEPDVRVDVLTTLPADDSSPAGFREPASSLTRVFATLFPAGLDRRLAAGESAVPGSALAVRIERLTSRRERHQLAATLREVVREAREGSVFNLSSRVRLDRAAIIAAAGDIESVALRLRSTRPVRAQGMARLRLLLTDGTGPLYRLGRGDLADAVRQILAGL